MKLPKDIKRLLGRLREQGWGIEQGTRHVVVVPRDKTKRKVTISGTPSDYRAYQNTIAELRRSGARI